jgi:hypothetical protein
MRVTPKFATAFLASLFLGACAPMGDAWLDFGGVVSDTAGHPIKGARVSIMVNGKTLDRGGSTTTDSQGRYSFHASSCPCDFNFDLQASASGFRPYSLTLSGAQANRLARQDITLVPR